MTDLDLATWWHRATAANDLRVTHRYRPHHPGLYLDRCLPMAPEEDQNDDSAGDKPHKKLLFDSAIEALNPGAPATLTYTPRYQRWRAALGRSEPLREVRALEIETLGRALIHPGANTTVTDATVLLHHTYGVPMLPGSGLKGLMRAWGRRRAQEGTLDLDDLGALLGPERDAEEHRAALVNVLDALWIPGSPAGQSPLGLDVVTPHHGDYYTGDQPPADWQQPVPSSRLVLQPGVRFCAILEGCAAPPGQIGEWLDLATELLDGALTHLGFGAYTAAGYGRMRLDSPPATTVPRRERLPATLLLDPGSGALTATLPGGKKAGARGAEAARLRELLPEAARVALRARKPVQVTVEIEPEGLGARITDLTPR